MVISILLIQNFLKNYKNTYFQNDKHDYVVDIMKAMLITSMIIGHFKIDSTLRHIIFSCHMGAFIILSGYFYKKRKILNNLQHDIKTMIIPYSIFSLIYIMINSNHSKIINLIDCIFSMSFSNKILTDISSIGPVYFITLLFVIKNLYNFIVNKVNNEKNVTIYILLLSFIGVYLGVIGIWLPWSFDVALYALILYHIGFIINKYDIFRKITNLSFLYFIISILWSYAVYASYMEIAIRNYNPYFITIMGATTGTILLYMLCNYIFESKCFYTIKSIIVSIGQSTMFILIVHTLFGSIINKILSNNLNSQYIYLLIISLCIQLAIGIIISKIYKQINYKFIINNPKKQVH